MGSEEYTNGKVDMHGGFNSQNVATEKTSWSQLLVVVIFLHCMYSDVNGHVCPIRNPTETPRFTKRLGKASWASHAQAAVLLCCAEGYDYIRWYKMKNDYVSESLPKGTELDEDNQVLKFLRTDKEDEALYRCSVFKDDNVVMNHTVKLHVNKCEKSSRGPLMVDPSPSNQTIYKYGGNLTLNCTGDFGCQDVPYDPFDIVLWSVLGTAEEITHISPRYSVVPSRKDKNDTRIVQSTLTITSVSEEDTERTFICVVANPQVVHGQTKKFITITKKDMSGVTKKQIALIIGSCSLFTISMIIVLCIRFRYSPQFRLFVNNIVPKLGPKYIDNMNIVWNLYIHHADEDEGVATQLKNELENLGYNVRITADMKSGNRKMNDFKEAITRSALVFFLFSENLLAEEMADLFLQIVVIERNGKDIMFLEQTNFKPRQIQGWARNAKIQKRGQSESNSVNIRIEEDSEVAVEEDSDVKIAKKIEDIRFWRTIPRFKVPKEGASKRIKKNFLCSLRNNIPRFKKQDREKGGKKVVKDRSDSSMPLLEDPLETQRSPDGVENPTFEMFPGMIAGKTNEFYYDEASVMKIAQAGDFDRLIIGEVGNAEWTNPESSLIDYEDADLFIENKPYIRENIITDAVVHDQQMNVTANKTKNRNIETESGKTGRNLEISEPVRAKLVHSKEGMFTMSGEEELTSGSQNAESSYASSFEESSRGGSFTSETGNSSSYASSPEHSASRFDSQSSEAPSPPIMSNPFITWRSV